MKKVLPQGDNHPLKFIGSEVSEELYARFSQAARKSHRSRGGMVRHLIENMDLILSLGDNHPKKGRSKNEERIAGRAVVAQGDGFVLPKGDNHQGGKVDAAGLPAPAGGGL